MDNFMYKVLHAWWFDIMPDTSLSEKTFHHLLNSYSEDHRHYHTEEHIYNVLGEIEDDMKYPPFSSMEDRTLVYAAAFYHDIVYDPQAVSGKNEADSAKRAYVEMRDIGFNDQLCARVAELISCTYGHKAASLEEKLLVNADLAILASVPKEYAKYAMGIREEYNFVDDKTYVKARIKFLNSLLDRKYIFYSSAQIYNEEPARQNICWEIEELEENGVLSFSSINASLM